jgi:hypothetical protein
MWYFIVAIDLLKLKDRIKKEKGMAEFFKSIASFHFIRQFGDSFFEPVPGLDIFNKAEKDISCHMIILFKGERSEY